MWSTVLHLQCNLFMMGGSSLCNDIFALTNFEQSPTIVFLHPKIYFWCLIGPFSYTHVSICKPGKIDLTYCRCQYNSLLDFLGMQLPTACYFKGNQARNKLHILFSPLQGLMYYDTSDLLL